MASVRADCHSVPVTFPLGTDGFAMVTSTTLGLRFQLREDSLYVEEEIYDDSPDIVSRALGQLSIQSDIGTFWLLKPGKYRTYGVAKSGVDSSAAVFTTRTSSTVCLETPLPAKVKLEPGLHTIYELSDESE